MKNYETKGALGKTKVDKLVARGYRFDEMANGFILAPINGFSVNLLKVIGGKYFLSFSLPNGFVVEPARLEIYTDENTFRLLEEEVRYLRTNKIFS